MKINKVLIITAAVLMILGGLNLLRGEVGIYDYAGESVSYLISPLGRSEYNDLGTVDLNGIKVNLVTLKTKILFFENMDKIYSDPESLLPYKLERTFSKLWFKEFMTEEYDQKNFIMTRRRFKGKRLISEQIIKASGPIQNPVTLPFYLRNSADFKVGWNFTARFPDEYKFELVSIDGITVVAGKFQAYHLKSIPDKYEIWINKDDPRVPLKITGKNIFGCSLLMKQYSLNKK